MELAMGHVARAPCELRDPLREWLSSETLVQITLVK